MHEPLRKALCEQVVAEFHAAYMYLGMAVYFEVESWQGFAHWMRLQSEEEVRHGLRILKFLYDRGVKVELQEIPSVSTSFASPLEVFRKAHEHEKKVSERIHHLYALALEAKDYQTQVMLQWFEGEQVEEEKITAEAAILLERAGSDNAALVVLDQRFGSRTAEEEEE